MTTDTRLDYNEIRVGICHRLLLPETEEEITTLLSLPDFDNRILIEHLMGMVAIIMFEEILLPII